MLKMNTFSLKIEQEFVCKNGPFRILRYILLKITKEVKRRHFCKKCSVQKLVFHFLSWEKRFLKKITRCKKAAFPLKDMI